MVFLQVNQLFGHSGLYIKLRLCYLTSFAIQPDTQMLLLVSFIIEGPVVMILAIGSNLLAYASYKAFMKRKSMTTSVAFNVNRQQLAINTRAVELTEIEKRRQAKKEKKNKKLFNMTIYLTISSILLHVIQFGAQLIIFVFSSFISASVYSWATFAYIFMIILKHYITIIFFYYFNSNFKTALKKLFCCSCCRSNNGPSANINNNNNNN